RPHGEHRPPRVGVVTLDVVRDVGRGAAHGQLDVRRVRPPGRNGRRRVLVRDRGQVAGPPLPRGRDVGPHHGRRRALAGRPGGARARRGPRGGRRRGGGAGGGGELGTRAPAAKLRVHHRKDGP